MRSNTVGEVPVVDTTALAHLADVDWTQYPSSVRLQTMADLEQLSRRALAISGGIGVSLTEIGEHELSDRPFKAIADTLRITTAESKRRLTRAQALAPRSSFTGEPLPAALPGTATAWHDGHLDPDHVSAITKFLTKLPNTVDPRKRDAGEQYLAQQGQQLRPEQLAQLAEHMDEVLNPDGVLDDGPQHQPGMSWTGQRRGGLTKGVIWADAELKAALDAAFSKFARYGATNPFPDPTTPAQPASDGQLTFDDNGHGGGGGCACACACACDGNGCATDESTSAQPGGGEPIDTDGGETDGGETGGPGDKTTNDSPQDTTPDTGDATIDDPTAPGDHTPNDDQPTITPTDTDQPATSPVPQSGSAATESDPPTPPERHDTGPPGPTAPYIDTGPPRPAVTPTDTGPPGTSAGTGTGPETLPPDPVRDTRGAAHRRHDALKWLLLAMLGNPALGRHKGLPLTIVVTAAYDQLATLTGTAVTATGDRIPIRKLLRMAAQHGAYHYLSIFHDAQHRELYYGRTRRIATGEQYLTLFGLERGCSFPGCTRPADDCDVHHMSPDWANGATTDINGLTLGCTSTHHPAATAGRYTTVRNDNGYTEWHPTPPVTDNLPTTPHTPEVTDCHLADRNPLTNDAHHPEKRLAPFLKKLHEIDNPDHAETEEPQQDSPDPNPPIDGPEDQAG